MPGRGLMQTKMARRCRTLLAGLAAAAAFLVAQHGPATAQQNQIAQNVFDLSVEAAMLSACSGGLATTTGGVGTWGAGTVAAINCHPAGLNAMANASNRTVAAIAANVLPAQFPSGRLRVSDHDGFKATVNPTFRTPSSEISEVSALVTGEINLTKHLNLAMGRTLRVGAYVGYDKLDANIETNAFFAGFGINRIGDANNDSVLVGGYALYTMGTVYLLTITGIDFGETDTKNFLTGFLGSYDTFGVVTGTAIGKVFTLSQRGGGMKDKKPTRAVKLDVRAGLTYSHHEADGYTETGIDLITGAFTDGIRFGDATIDDFSGSLSATLFADIQKASGNLWRPFLKLGIKHRFVYDNELDIPAQVVATGGMVTTLGNGITIDFDDADTFWNVEGGVQIATTKKMTFNGSLYYEGSEDIDTFGGRLGVKWALN